MPIPLQPDFQWLIDKLRDPGHDDGIRSTAAHEIERLCRRVDLWTESTASALKQVRRLDEKLREREEEVAHLRTALLVLVGPSSIPGDSRASFDDRGEPSKFH